MKARSDTAASAGTPADTRGVAALAARSPSRPPTTGSARRALLKQHVPSVASERWKRIRWPAPDEESQSLKGSESERQMLRAPKRML